MNCNLLEKLGLFRGVCADQVLKKKRLKCGIVLIVLSGLCRSGAEEEAIEIGLWLAVVADFVQIRC